MKTFLLVVLAIIAATITLANLGPLLALVISLCIAYYATKKFILTDSVAEKVLWGIVILITISISLSNIPALIGVASFVVLYYTYKKWKQERYMKDEFLMSDKY